MFTFEDKFMFRPFLNRFFTTLLTITLVVGTQAGRSDDTEIYFSGGSSSTSSSTAIRPNVLFILDTSGSMDNDLTGDPEGRSRIEVLRETMAEIIADIQNVNLGLMRFTSNDGGPVLFPVTFIDETLDNVVGADIGGDGEEFTYERIASADAEEDILATSSDYGTVTTNNVGGFAISRTAFQAEYIAADEEEDLEFYLPNNSSDAEEETDRATNNMSQPGFGLSDDELEVDPDSMIGLRYTFTPGTIPKCSAIADANLRLVAIQDDSGTQVIKVWAQDSDSTSVFTTINNNLSSRPDTDEFVRWDPDAFEDDEVYTLDDGVYDSGTRLEDVIEEVVMRGCSAVGANDGTWDESSLVIFLSQYSGTNDRNFYSRNESSSRAPRLLITLTSAGETVPEVAATQRLIALRFEDVRIPEGADVTSASLQFIPSTDAGSNGDNIMRIYGEKVANAAAFTSDDFHLSQRFTANPTTSFARWNIPAWTENNTIETTNTHVSNTLEDVLEEITADGGGWCGGNALTLFLYAETDDDLRFAKSLENINDAFTLDFTYESSLTDGCYVAEASKQLEVSQDDAQQLSTNAIADVNESSIPFNSQMSGFRFTDMAIPVDSTIISATIEFQSTATTTSAGTNVTITGELPTDANADTFQAALDNISTRLSSDTSASVTWNVPTNLAYRVKFNTPDLTNIIQEIVDDGDWASGNAIAILMQPSSSTGGHGVYSRDGSSSRAPKLTVTYRNEGVTITKTARENMIELVEQLPSADNTPILEVLYEAAHYWRGENIVFGKNRNGSQSVLSHPGSYCSDNGDGTYDCNGATIDGDTDEFGIDYETGCDPDDEADWESTGCDGSFIKGSPKYISPFNTASTCQANYQIFLTDGELYDGDGEVATEIKNEYTGTCLANNSSFKGVDDDNYTYNASGSHVELCAVDLVKYMNEIDQIPDNILDNDQTVQTSTVAFDLSGGGAQYMRDIANLGGGEFYEASSASDLVSIFASFLASVRDVPTSFVAPSLATNAFNRLLSRDEVYFGLFTPELDRRWDGNIKKYNICVDTADYGGCTLGEIVDANGDAAINAVSERFDDTARSIWTAVDIEDGGNTVIGGAGAEITNYQGMGGVRIFTEVGGNSASGSLIATNTTLNTTGYVYKESSAVSNDWAADNLRAMRELVCDPAPPTPVDLNHANSADCKARMRWLLGKKTFTDPESDINVDQRWTVTDVLHSSPVVITYGGADTSDPADGIMDSFYDKLIYGTNDGAVHMVNGSDGSEDWRFIPNELMSQQRVMYTNPEGEHLYGMDVTPTVRVVDHNRNGVIEIPDADGNNDSVIAYMAMRSGGDLMYALDISGEMSSTTTSINPKYLWRIQGGAGSFPRLTETWSRPTLATIETTTGPLEVLIFGGGYDNRLEDDESFGTEASSGSDNMGNAIYVVNALTGAKVLSVAGNSTAGADGDIEVANMKYAIPSRISVLDSDRDGFHDRLYVGDTAGQVWRVDLGNDVIAAGGVTAAATCQLDPDCDQTIVGRLASVSAAADVVDQRRFFEPPSVVQVTDTEFADGIGGEYDYVLIGSGYRSHPLNEEVEDRFYAFRDVHIDGMTAQAGTNLAAGYPKLNTPGTEGVPLGHAITNELVNITTQTLEDAVDDAIDVGNALGWYFDFNESNTSGGVVTEPGEKVLSAPISIAGTVFFTTYLPSEDDTEAEVCVGAQIGSGRAYNLNILTTKAAIDWDGDGDIDMADRGLALGGGIPSDVVPVFTKEGVVGIVGIEGGATQLGTLAGLPRFRTYWYEE